MNVQELTDKYANGTINPAEQGELFAAAAADPALRATLDELRRIDELLDFPKSERGKRVIGYLDGVEAAVLATMAAAPIAATQLGWLYGAAGTVGGLAVAGAVWFAVSSSEPAADSKPAASQPPAAPAPVAPQPPPQDQSAPAITEAPALKPVAKPQENQTRARTSETVDLHGTPGSGGENAAKLADILADIARAGDDKAVLADLHFKAAMLLKANPADAKKHLNSARAFALNINLMKTAGKALAELAALEHKAGNTSQATTMLDAAIVELRTANSPEVRRWERLREEMNR